MISLHTLRVTMRIYAKDSYVFYDTFLLEKKVREGGGSGIYI